MIFAFASSPCAAAPAGHAGCELQIVSEEEEREDEETGISYRRSFEVPVMTGGEKPETGEKIEAIYREMYLKPREEEIAGRLVEIKETWGEESAPGETVMAEPGADSDSLLPGIPECAFGDVIECGRADDLVISLRIEYWNQAGGPYPVSEYRGAVFDSSAGTLLDLSDLLVSDGKSAEKIASLVEEELRGTEGLYDPEALAEYARTVVEAKDHWYLNEEGLVFFFCPEEIAPHAAGKIEILLPYEELGELVQAPYLEQGEPLRVERISAAERLLWRLRDALLEMLNGKRGE